MHAEIPRIHHGVNPDQHRPPRRTSHLGTDLRRIAPNLRRLGVAIEFPRSGAARRIEISKKEQMAVTVVTGVTDGDVGSDDGDTRNGEVTPGDGTVTGLEGRVPPEESLDDDDLPIF